MGFCAPQQNTYLPFTIFLPLSCKSLEAGMEWFMLYLHPGAAGLPCSAARKQRSNLDSTASKSRDREVLSNLFHWLRRLHKCFTAGLFFKCLFACLGGENTYLWWAESGTVISLYLKCRHQIHVFLCPSSSPSKFLSFLELLSKSKCIGRVRELWHTLKYCPPKSNCKVQHVPF